MENILMASSSPHKKTRQTTKSIMLDVIIALLPAAIAGIVFFGYKAAIVMAISVITAVATEFIWLFACRKSFKEILRQFDLTSIVTGLILAMCLNSECTWYVVVISSAFSIAVVKMFFGGTGKNIVNPAATGRVFAFIAFQSIVVSGYVVPAFAPDSIVSGATPLPQIASPVLSNLQLFLGIGVQGCIGETCKAAILLGYVYLVARRVLDWKWPLITIAVAGLMSVAVNDGNWAIFLPAILSGGLFFGATFMTTDYVTSPKTQLGNIVYCVLTGILVAVLRKATSIEVMSFVILLMNFVTPLLDRYIRPRPFGYQKPKKEVKA